MLDAGVITNLEIKRYRAPTQSSYLSLKLLEGSLIAAGENKICTCPGESASKNLPEAAARTGHDRHPAAEIEE